MRQLESCVPVSTKAPGTGTTGHGLMTSSASKTVRRLLSHLGMSVAYRSTWCTSPFGLTFGGNDIVQTLVFELQMNSQELMKP